LNEQHRWGGFIEDNYNNYLFIEKINQF